jgi:hypothetical protein
MRIVEKTFFTKSEASVSGVPAFIETDRFCRSSHHHHHSSSSSLSRVRARARTNTLARDGSRASRRTRRRRAETGRDRTFGTGASSWVARSPVPSPPSRSFPKPPSLFAHTTAFRWTRDSPLDPPQHERRPTPRAASASPRRDARAWARPSPRTSPQPVRYVRRSSGDAPSKTSSLNRNPRDAKKRHLGVFFFSRKTFSTAARRSSLTTRKKRAS